MKKCIVITLILFINILLFAQTNYRDLFEDLTNDNNSTEDATKDTSKAKRIFDDMHFNIALIGEHAFEFRVPVIEDNMNFDGYIKSPKIKNDFGIEVSFKNLVLISHWQFDIILNEWGDIKKFLELLPLENYIAWSPWKFRLAIGFQNFNWGVGDKINPTDNVNVKDYRHPYNPRKIPSFSISAAFFPAKFISMEVLYIPFYLQLPSDFAYDKIEDSYKDAEIIIKSSIDPAYFSIGGKLNFFLRYADFSFSYLTQVEPYYSMDLDLKKTTEYDQTYYTIDSLELLNRRIHNIGADFKTTVGIFGIWLELCYSISEDILMDRVDIRNHQLSYVAGFDFNYGPDSDFYFNFQYFGYYNPLFYTDYYNDYDNGEFELNKSENYYNEFYYRTLTDSLALIREGLLHGVSLRMEWSILNDLLTPSFETVYSIPIIYDTNREARYGNLYFNPQIDIMPLDSFHILLGADLFFSWNKLKNKLRIDEENITGSNYINSSVYLEVRYKWGIDFKK